MLSSLLKAESDLRLESGNYCFAMYVPSSKRSKVSYVLIPLLHRNVKSGLCTWAATEKWYEDADLFQCSTKWELNTVSSEQPALSFQTLITPGHLMLGSGWWKQITNASMGKRIKYLLWQCNLHSPFSCVSEPYRLYCSQLYSNVMSEKRSW